MCAIGVPGPLAAGAALGRGAALRGAEALLYEVTVGLTLLSLVIKPCLASFTLN